VLDDAVELLLDDIRLVVLDTREPIRDVHAVPNFITA
jgi:hypothetical protein